MNVDPMNPRGAPNGQALATLGATHARIEFKDSATAGQPPSAFGVYDPYIADLLAHGISVLLILDYATLPGRPTPPSGDNWGPYGYYFALRCGDIAAHYNGKVSGYEIWNEPDLPSVGNVEAGTYGTVLAQAYKAIKSADGNAAVVMGGLASGDPNYVAQARSQAGAIYADAIGLHPYGQRPTPDWPNPTWGFGNVVDLLNNYWNVEPKPVVITEVGTDDMNVQAQFASHLFDSLNSQGSVNVCFWFCWSDAMVPPFGVVDGSGNPKPSYYDYQSWAKQAQNRSINSSRNAE